MVDRHIGSLYDPFFHFSCPVFYICVSYGLFSSKKRMRPLTMPIPMTMTGVLAVCCLVLGCAADLPAVENSKSVADTGRSRFKRRAVNICQLTKHSVEEISDSTKDSLQEIREALSAMQSSLEKYNKFVCLFSWLVKIYRSPNSRHAYSLCSGSLVEAWSSAEQG